ncbi:hypothetical protein K501DRAFT_28619 [Backusella circina FSU 941]|nr:hypothetical protein K501DRAFT_28619 [Backusella circina FSU 941]
MNEINLNDTNIQQYILDDIISDWRFGIKPSGELAKRPYLSEQFRPDFSVAKPFKKEDSKVICDTDWTQNLARSGIYEKWDGITMNSLSVTRPLTQTKKKKTHYQIECTPFMLINLSTPKRVTDELNKKLVAIESQHDAVKDYKETWKSLRLLFEEYGFLWPEIIVIGYKQFTLLEKSASCETDDKKLNIRSVIHSHMTL